MSPRTYSRRVAELLDYLGVATRFQAGVKMVQRGWLTGPYEAGLNRPGLPGSGDLIHDPELLQCSCEDICPRGLSNDSRSARASAAPAWSPMSSYMRRAWVSSSLAWPGVPSSR